jgi:adenylyl-sulfate kinase
LNNIFHQTHAVDNAKWAKQKNQTPFIIWFTGFSGSVKTTLSNLLDHKLQELGYHTYILDGDNTRLGLNRDLGFSDDDRRENIRRSCEVAKLLVDAGLIVLVAFISPFRAAREMVRQMNLPSEFVEVYVDIPLDVCEQRDPKGLYKKARLGLIKNFTGIDSKYEPPLNPEIHLNNHSQDAEKMVGLILDDLRKLGYISQ